jgi:mRNA interferase MazF
VTVGDLHWVSFPTRGGHAQAGRRPALIVQSADASTRLPTVLLVPLTTQIDALRFPGTVLIEPDAGNGLRRPSIALVFQITAVDKQFVEERLGMASQTTIQTIWQALDEITAR